jgi:hypothetical protein
VAGAAGGGGEAATETVPGPTALHACAVGEPGDDVAGGVRGHPAGRVADRLPVAGEGRGDAAVPVDAHEQRGGTARGAGHPDMVQTPA